MADRLNGYRVLILETREEAQFSRLLSEQGADVLQCPMFAINDAPDPAPIEAWIRRAVPRKGRGALNGPRQAQGAEVDAVLPYVYDAKGGDGDSASPIGERARGRGDAMALPNVEHTGRLNDTPKQQG